MGAFSAGIFHLMTHAFFKALLFLGAGSVIHAMQSEQDIRKMGGLKTIMPKTYWTFLAASLAISGIPPLSGFFSKDEILWKTFIDGSTFLYIIALLTAMMTAFYVFRLFYLTFEGNKRWSENVHPHESPSIMTIPLTILGVLSIIGGFIGIPTLFVGEHGNLFESWLAPVYEPALNKITQYHEYSHTTEFFLMLLSAVVAICSILLARYFYLKNINPIQSAISKFNRIYNLLLNKYWVDEIYDFAVVNPIKFISEKFFWKIGDVKIIDGFLDGTAALIDSGSRFIRKIQTGVAQFYALIMMIGMALIIFFLFVL